MEYNLIDSLRASFQTLGRDLIGFIPELVVAILVVIVGWILGNILKNITERVFATLKLDAALDKAGVDTLTEKAGYSFKPGHFVGSLIKWFMIIVFVVVALDILGLNEVTGFFSGEVLTYLPRVIVAALILFGSMLLAQFVSASVTAAARAASFKAADMLGSFTRYAILTFAVLAALSQLQIAGDLVNTLFMGVVFAASLAFGLAFGLGGRDAAAKYITELTGKGGGGSHHGHGGGHHGHH